MVLENSNNRTRLTANGVLVDFDYTFKIFVDTDIQVYEIDTTGAATLQTIGTHYTVALSTTVEGGTVTFLTAPANSFEVLMIRNTPNTQGADIPVNGGFSEKVIEQGLDRLAMQIQQLQDSLDKTIQISATSTVSGITVPDPESEKLLRWKSDLSGLENILLTDISVIEADITIVGGDARKSVVINSGETGYELEQKHSLEDADGDTKIQLEKSADEDKIRFDTAGTQRAVLDSTGLTLETGVAVDKVLDEDSFSSDDVSALATQQSIKAYIAAQIAANAKALGAWASVTLGATAQAATDGFVVGWGISSTGTSLIGITDSSATPTTVRTRNSNNAGAAEGGMCMPVRSGDYYKVTQTNNTSNGLYFIPLS